MKDQLENTRAVMISGSVYTVLSIVSHLIYDDFMTRRGPVLFPRIIANYLSEYIITVAAGLLETLALIVFVSKLAKHLKPIATDYSIQLAPKEFVRLNNELEETSMLQLRALKRFRLLGMLTALMGTVLPAVLHLTDYYSIPYWMIHVCICVIFFVYAYVLCNRLRDGVLRRYERPEDVK